LSEEEVAARAADGSLVALPGVGPVSASIVADAILGRPSEYLRRLEEQAGELATTPAGKLFNALRGDCHVHSDWSDGRSSIFEMAESAIALGRDYIVLTDHSPTLRIARGLSVERLREQLLVVEELNAVLAPFRILTGIEVDILPDGALDQEDELLAGLDVVVASVHSLLRMDREAMTERMLTAVANPHLDILGHCTGRMRTRRRDRPESEFDSARVFAACARFGKAVEINSLPERRDPPHRLMREALEAGCWFSIDSDAHSTTALAGTMLGCRRAVESGISSDRVVNVLPADGLLDWVRSHDA
jgi:putative hydrolase